MIMKIFWIASFALVAVGSQPLMAYDDTLLRPYGHEHVQPRQQGKENSQPKPWETRPWEQQKATDEGPAGKKTQKERFEQQMEKRGLRNQNDVKQPQGKWENKWEKHRAEGERFNRSGLPPR
jgi:hypothetical protein